MPRLPVAVKTLIHESGFEVETPLCRKCKKITILFAVAALCLSGVRLRVLVGWETLGQCFYAWE